MINDQWDSYDKSKRNSGIKGKKIIKQNCWF